jgi:hypothetical protein
MDTILHVLFWGFLLTSGSFVILLGSWIIDPKIWGADLGADSQYQNKKGGLITVIMLLIFQISVMIVATQRLVLFQIHIGFWYALLINYCIYQFFNLLDLIVLDWLIYIKMKPAFMRPDYLPSAEKFSKHLIDFRNGLFIALIPVATATSIGFWL